MHDFSDAWEVFKGRCFPVEYALIQTFGGFYITPEGALKANCCGEVLYYSGIFGDDMAQCQSCGRAIRHILSPHVSPLLITNCGAFKPTMALFAMVGDHQWFVDIPKEKGDDTRSGAS